MPPKIDSIAKTAGQASEDLIKKQKAASSSPTSPTPAQQEQALQQQIKQQREIYMNGINNIATANDVQSQQQPRISVSAKGQQRGQPAAAASTTPSTPAQQDQALQQQIKQQREAYFNDINNTAAANDVQSSQRRHSDIVELAPKAPVPNAFAAPKPQAPSSLPRVETRSPAQREADEKRIVAAYQTQRIMQQPAAESPSAPSVEPKNVDMPLEDNRNAMQRSLDYTTIRMTPQELDYMNKNGYRAFQEMRASKNNGSGQTPSSVAPTPPQQQQQQAASPQPAPATGGQQTPNAFSGGNGQQAAATASTSTPAQQDQTLRQQIKQQREAYFNGINEAATANDVQSQQQPRISVSASSQSQNKPSTTDNNSRQQTPRQSVSAKGQQAAAAASTSTPNNNPPQQGNNNAAAANGGQQNGEESKTKMTADDIRAPRVEQAEEEAPKGGRELTANDVNAIKNFTSEKRDEVDRNNVDTINAFRQSLGLKPVHINSQKEKEQWQQEKYEGEAKVKAKMDEAKRKANKKTWRDYLFGSKTDEEWNKKRREKIAAIYDLVVNLGNLGTTALAGAVPQKLESAYDKVKKQHDKENADKDAKDKADRDFKFKQNEADRDYNISLGNLEVKQNADKRQQDLQPHEMARAIANANKAKTDAETAAKTQADKIREAAGKADLAGERVKGQQAQTALSQARQKKAESDAEWAPKEHAASVNQKKASAAASRASAANSYAAAATQKARRAQIQQSIRNNGDFEIPSNQTDKNWRIAKSQQATLNRELQGVAKKKGWYAKYYNVDGSLKSGVKAEDLLVEAFAHTEDRDVQELLGKHGTLVNTKTDAKTRRKVATTLK